MRCLIVPCLLAVVASICEDFGGNCRDWKCSSTRWDSTRDCPVTCSTEATNCPAAGFVEEWPFEALASQGLNNLCSGSELYKNNSFNGYWWDCQKLCEASPACKGYNFMNSADYAQCTTFRECELLPSSGMDWRVAKRPANSTVNHVCGDGVASGAEECDGTSFAIHAGSRSSYGDCQHLTTTCTNSGCTTLGNIHGVPTCKSDCTVDTSGCYYACPGLCADSNLQAAGCKFANMVNVMHLTSSYIGYSGSAPWESNFAGSSSGTFAAMGLVSCSSPLYLDASGDRVNTSMPNYQAQIVTSRYGHPEKGSQCSLQCPDKYMALENDYTCCNGEYTGTVKCGMTCEDYAPFAWCQANINECDSAHSQNQKTKDVRTFCRKTCTAQCNSWYSSTTAQNACLDATVSLCGQHFTDLVDVGTDRFQGTWSRTNPQGGSVLDNLVGLLPQDIAKVSSVTVTVQNRVNVSVNVPAVDKPQIKGFVYGNRMALSDGTKFAEGFLKSVGQEWHIHWLPNEVWTRDSGLQNAQISGNAQRMGPKDDRWVKEGSGWRDLDFPANSVGTAAEIQAWQASAPAWAPVGLVRTTVDKVPPMCSAGASSSSSSSSASPPSGTGNGTTTKPDANPPTVATTSSAKYGPGLSLRFVGITVITLLLSLLQLHQ